MNIFPLNKDTYLETVNLLKRYYKEYKGELTHNVEIESILKNKNNKTFVAVNEVNKVVGVYVYTETGNTYFVHVVILDPIIRKTKKGYLIWKDMVDRLKNKPAIISVIKNNNAIRELIKKRATFVGVYLSELDGVIEYYNLTFKEQ